MNVTTYGFGVQIAYSVCEAVGVNVANAVVPVVVADQPLKVYPVLIMVPTVGKVVIAEEVP